MLRKTPKEKLQALLKKISNDKPVQMEIDKGIITIKDEKGEFIFSLKGKVKIETNLRECEKCNSEGRKKELEALAADREELEAKDTKLRELERRLDERTKAVIEHEDKLKAREKEIKDALKVLTK